MKEYRVAMAIATAIVVLIGICVLSYLLTPYRHGEASLFIDTYGDSITDQGSYGTQTSHQDYQRNNYQRHLYDYLLLRGVESVISNFGIGGQLITQICNRYLYAFTSAKYIIFMAGTNDVLSGGPQNITNLILSQYARILNGKKHIFICSIPPVARHNDIIPGKSEELSKVIVNVNDSLEQFLRHRHDVTFCNVHKYLSGNTRYYLPGISTDGVHLNERGRKILGEAIGNCVFLFTINEV